MGGLQAVYRFLAAEQLVSGCVKWQQLDCLKKNTKTRITSRADVADVDPTLGVSSPVCLYTTRTRPARRLVFSGNARCATINVTDCLDFDDTATHGVGLEVMPFVDETERRQLTY